MKPGKAATRQARQLIQGVSDEFSAIVEDASKADKDGRWGLDSWVRIIHDLVDLQVRTAVSVIQTAMAGPWWTDRPDEEMRPETVEVEAANYPRIVGASAFARIGQPKTTIPAYSLDLDPDVLPPGANQIEILLKDNRFVGSNYRGKITLTHATDPTAKPHAVEVTVGL